MTQESPQPQKTAEEGTQGTYKQCPLCNGTGWAVNPKQRAVDSRCRICQGTGVVAEKCVCGRPALMGPSGYVGLGRYYCGLTGCREIIEKQIGAQDPEDKPTQKGTGFMWDDKDDWWGRGWCC